jgi:hypothetical protein
MSKADRAPLAIGASRNVTAFLSRSRCSFREFFVRGQLGPIESSDRRRDRAPERRSCPIAPPD